MVTILDELRDLAKYADLEVNVFTRAINEIERLMKKNQELQKQRDLLAYHEDEKSKPYFIIYDGCEVSRVVERRVTCGTDPHFDISYRSRYPKEEEGK